MKRLAPVVLALAVLALLPVVSTAQIPADTCSCEFCEGPDLRAICWDDVNQRFWVCIGYLYNFCPASATATPETDDFALFASDEPAEAAVACSTPALEPLVVAPAD